MIKLDKDYVIIWGARTHNGYVYRKEEFPVDIEKEFYVMSEYSNDFKLKNICAMTNVCIDNIGFYVENFRFIDTQIGKICKKLGGLGIKQYVHTQSMGSHYSDTTTVHKLIGFYISPVSMYDNLPAKIIKKQRKLKLNRIKNA